MRLPRIVQDVADVIGRDRALYLIGNHPKTPDRFNKTARVCVYVPKPERMKVTHPLSALMGWNDAVKLSQVFGGEILILPSCSGHYRQFRDAAMRRLIGEGVPHAMIADWFGVCERTVKNLAREKPREEKTPANDNNRD